MRPVQPLIAIALSALCAACSNGTESADANRPAGSGAAAPPPAGSGARGITWATSAGGLDWQGDIVLITCPPNGTAHNVWGHDVYTGDSSVCTAAVHRSAITLERGGPITVARLPG